jgi:nucleoside-diphosphate kinase
MTKSSHLQTTLVLLKPDAVRRGILGEIISRLERAGLVITAARLVNVTQELAAQHYLWEDIGVRHGEAVWKNLITFITSGPVLALAVYGDHAVEVVRKLCGPTEPLTAPPGTIRGDFCHHSFALSRQAGQSVRNVIHASASPEEAERELGLWFSPSDFCPVDRNDHDEHFFN